ncbi:MAG: PAS domain-containing sensor histidine kinase [Deltaproteobacteria bacterium]|nr:PAS domain-containing sensor histidine kinase [Deltaproteobacteria bacterium]MBZ0219589.1 PAS domain-containing sensor histidine kinase [Deltaproteobacteria bacterium]
MLKEGSLSLDRQGRIIRFSHSLEDMLGYTSDEAMGKEFSMLVPPGAESPVEAFLDGSEEEARPASGKTGMLRKDGRVSELYLSIHPLRDRTGALYSVLLTLSMKKTGLPAYLTEEFRRIFKFSNDGVAITDRDGSIIDVNPAFLDTYGYQRHEVLGRNPRILKSHHSTGDLYERMWQDILDPSKGFWRGEIINIARDGSEVPVLLSINAIKDEHGEIRNFLGIAFNMTREKKLEKLRKMYIDHIVHDIRGPLTSISINSELLLMGQEFSEKARKKLDVILSSAQRIESMTSDILDFSRAENGKLAVRREAVRLSDTVRDAALPFEGSGKRLLLNGALFSEGTIDIEVHADEDKLRRIIYNLLSNAFKHASETVDISAGLDSDGLRFTVWNDGKGISHEEAERIFDAFYQTAEGIKTGGAGLGLSIVKSFVEAHGGKVWVEAGKERGVTFGFTIPFEPANMKI